MFKINGKELLSQTESEKEAKVEGNRKLSKKDGAHKLYHHITLYHHTDGVAFLGLLFRES